MPNPHAKTMYLVGLMKGAVSKAKSGNRGDYCMKMP